MGWGKIIFLIFLPTNLDISELNTKYKLRWFQPA